MQQMIIIYAFTAFEIKISIRITSPCDLYPLTPQFYIVKLGCTGVYIFFLIFAQNIDCGYTLEPPQYIDCGYTLEPPQ